MSKKIYIYHQQKFMMIMINLVYM